MAYNTREITHGTNNVAMGAGQDGQAGTGLIYSTGVAKFAPSTDQDNKDIFADSQSHMVLLNPKQITIEMDNYQYTKEEFEQMGYNVDTSGAMTDNGSNKPFAIQRLLKVLDAKGTETQRLEVFYNVTSSDYSENDDEDEDEINPKIYTRTLKVGGIDVNGTNVKKLVVIRNSSNATQFDKYKTKIMLPSDFATATK